MQTKVLFLGLSALILAGCATSTSYIHYTTKQFPPKDINYTENIYPATQALPAGNPYYVIGRVSVEGYASDGVSPESLANKARIMAQKRGADAIINASTVIYRIYSDELLRFKGELIVYSSPTTN